MSPEQGDSDVLWGLEDYAVFVPTSDKFYQNLAFVRITEDQFRSGRYQGQPAYADSRAYLRTLQKHFLNCVGNPADVVDVGGYIGRFCIESALLSRELGIKNRTLCMEPGETRELLRRNLELNGMSEEVELLAFAASDRRSDVAFAVKSDAKITSRVVQNSDSSNRPSGDDWRVMDVKAIPLADILLGLNDAVAPCASADPHDPGTPQASRAARAPHSPCSPYSPFICKIDTEGHEVHVLRGLGEDLMTNTPNALVLEYWPVLRKRPLFERTFEEFVLENYMVFDIRSALYPKGFRPLADLDDVSERIHRGEVNNLDLLLVGKSIPNVDELIRRLV